MGILLEAIQFNHNPNSATDSALNLRKSVSQTVAVPEWRRGVSIGPEDSPVAYSIAETRCQTITIKARFRRLDPDVPDMIQVRAIDATGPFNGAARVHRRLANRNILGEVAHGKVRFGNDGLSDYETFSLKGTQLERFGVGAWTAMWQWQFRTRSSSPWSNFDRTEHRIYTLIDTPKGPWVQLPFDASNTLLPWTDILEYSCRWAHGSRTVDETAAGVTKGVYNLGPSILEYDCPGNGGSHYMAVGGIAATAFLDLLRGGIGHGRYVNCDDCANIVVTFANILGCDLWPSEMYADDGNQFALNPLLSIGSTQWQVPCGWLGFLFHKVAWKADCDVDDAVFDACLQVDGDKDPTANDPCHTPIAVAGLRFGTPGSGEYRDRLVSPEARERCKPQPWDVEVRFRPPPM